MFLGRTLCQLIQTLGLKRVIPWQLFWFLFFLLILCLLNVSNKSYNGTVSDQLSAQHKGGLVSVDWKNVMLSHGAATALNEKFLGIFF